MPKEVQRYYRILRKPRVTEKGLRMAERHRAYPFEVAETANKVEIRQAVEAIFNVKVESVRTRNMLGKMRRLGRSWGRRPSWKKAIVKLQAGHAIEDFY
jgi:large subunit ribosomal protein L23